MHSVQVRILQRGRTDAYGLPLVPGSVATVDRDYAVGLVYSGFASWINPEDAYDGETNLRKPNETYSIFTAGAAFGLLPGDGGANGLTFTDDIGNFTLSAAVITNFYLAFAGGGYCYFPAGAGGVLTDGWYWTVMSSDTAGRVYANKYEQGTGTPLFITSPTSLSGLTTGRITQTTSEVTAQTFIVPGGSMGPNGSLQILVQRAGDTTSNNKRIRVRINGTEAWLNTGTTTPVMDRNPRFQNSGTQQRQANSTVNGPGGASSGSIPAIQDTTIDLSVDSTWTITMQLAANTGGQYMRGVEAVVKYGA